MQRESFAVLPVTPGAAGPSPVQVARNTANRSLRARILVFNISRSCSIVTLAGW